MFHVVPERAHDLSPWRLFVAQEVKVSGVLDEAGNYGYTVSEKPSYKRGRKGYDSGQSVSRGS